MRLLNRRTDGILTRREVEVNGTAGHQRGDIGSAPPAVAGSMI
jgi:hypothetical protein